MSTQTQTPADRLDAIETRANAATAGPWEAEGAEVFTAGCGLFGGTVAAVYYGAETGGHHPAADRSFIVNARQDVPALVSALRAVLALHERTHSCGVAWYAESPDKAPLGARLDRCPTVTAITAALGDAS